MKTSTKTSSPKGAFSAGKDKEGKGLHNSLVYVRQHWQLYVFFMLPALALTIIFRYIPMGGILIAFEDYNAIKGFLGSPFVGFKHFQRFLSSPDFMTYLVNTLKLSIYGLLWGFPIPIFAGLPSEPGAELQNQAEDSAGALYAKLYFGYRSLWYRKDPLIRYRTFEPDAGYIH